jgi:ribosomal RNA-processing protein 7
MTTIKDFRVLRVPVHQSGCVYHYLYLKEHKSSAKKTLFVGNVDYAKGRNADEIDSIIRLLFEPFGSIESILLSADTVNVADDKSRFVHVEFSSKNSVKAALSAPESAFREASLNVAEQYGLEATSTVDMSTSTSSSSQHLPSSSSKKSFMKDIRKSFLFPYVSPNELDLELTEFMQSFEEAEVAERKLREKRSREADEDGFIQVKPRGKKKRKEGDKRGTGDTRSRNKKKKTGELQNFYRFQMRDQKVKKLDDLRKKFEEDRAKIADLKASRKFNPFK